jgi:hypothetical protein
MGSLLGTNIASLIANIHYQHEGTDGQSSMLYRLMMRSGESGDSRLWSRDDYDDVSVDVGETN